jgi:hypothetical protein
VEPISTIAAGSGLHWLIDQAARAIRENVIDPCSKRRARRFFDAFCQALLDEGLSEEDVPKNLDELFSDEQRAEIMFDAYRSVCLTKSRVVGPRIIALVTAKLVVSGSNASEVEESILAAAEMMNDAECVDFVGFVDSRVRELDSSRLVERNAFGALKTIIREVIDTDWMRSKAFPLGALNLSSDVGSWAAKLKYVGLLFDDIVEEQWKFKEDGERHVDQPGTAGLASTETGRVDSQSGSQCRCSQKGVRPIRGDALAERRKGAE